MPGAEIVAWLEVKTGLRLMPHVPGWPTPSLARALRLMTTQILKQGWWMVVSLPLVVLLPVLIPLRFRELGRHRQKTLFFALWLLPAIAFFVVGHMGMMTYLQVYLCGLCLFVTQLLFGDATSPKHLRRSLVIGLACIALNLAVFTLSRPFRAPGGIRRTFDLILMQYDGYSIHNGFGTSRRVGNLNVAEEATGPDADYINAPTDAALVEAARRNHFQYLPVRQ